MKVAILHGLVPEDAPNDEQDVLVQAEAVSQALVALGHEPVWVAFSVDVRRVIEELRSLKPDVVFNLVESVEGQGRLIYTGPAFLDFLQLPYTGGRTEAIFLTSNKLVAKKLLKGVGIRTPQWYTIADLQGSPTFVSGLYIIKPVWEHASVGLDEDSVISVTHPHELRDEMVRRGERLKGACLAEIYIEGREFNIAMLGGDGGPEVFPAAEIRFEEYPTHKLRVVGYRAKWIEESFEYGHTPRSFDLPEEDDPLVQHLKAVAGTCWNVFELRGYARVDFRVDHAGTAWVLEVNANPCIAPESGFIAAAERAGYSYHQVIKRIIEDAR